MNLVYLVFQGAQGFCCAAGEISGRQGWRVLANTPSAQTGQRSAMTQSGYGEKHTRQQE